VVVPPPATSSPRGGITTKADDIKAAADAMIMWAVDSTHAGEHLRGELPREPRKFRARRYEVVADADVPHAGHRVWRNY
jgi:hypothetical protein